MKLTFIHLGTRRTIVKHPSIVKALRAGTMTEAQAAAKHWYIRLRVNGKISTFKLPSIDKDAERAAKDLLTGRVKTPDQFQDFLHAREVTRGVTLGQLAADWIAAGLPHCQTEPRTASAVEELTPILERALDWWGAKPVAGVTPIVVEDFSGYRSPHLRAADKALSALSSLCKWAVLSGRLIVNPFAVRRRFAKVKRHCHEASPDDDETLHRVLAWMFEPALHAKVQAAESKAADDRLLILAGGTLAWCALTGLRAGEPSALIRQPLIETTPSNTRRLTPGALFRDYSGTLRMKVEREKKGQNPFVMVHSAAESLLCAWRAWLARSGIESDHLFPLGTEDHTTLNRALNRASRALSLPHFTTHGFGRAYYVKVRRSQGADDSAIAGELGQTTNGELIRSVYGDPDGMHGGSSFDWLPKDGAPAWALLASATVQPAVASPAVLHDAALIAA